MWARKHLAGALQAAGQYTEATAQTSQAMAHVESAIFDVLRRLVWAPLCSVRRAGARCAARRLRSRYAAVAPTEDIRPDMRRALADRG